jgi:membrane-associated phospholipid phosphatase
MPDLLVAPHRVTFQNRLSAGMHPSARWSERVVLLFLLYPVVLAYCLPAALSVRHHLLLLNPAIILAWSALIRFHSSRPVLALSVLRDWLPIALVPLAFREMGWFALPHHRPALELRWVVWDRAILEGGAKAAIECLGPLLPSVLEISYASVYALAPASLAALYLYRRRDCADRFLFVFCLGVLLCYAQFPFWPSEPPRAIFFGQDFPAYDSVIRRFNWWTLGHYGIHTSVFPSAHVAGAFASALGMRLALPSRPWVSRLLLGTAVLIAAATVYGRYHYLADAVAGFAVSLIAFSAGLLRDRLARRATAIQWHPRNSRHARTHHRGADARGT